MSTIALLFDTRELGAMTRGVLSQIATTERQQEILDNPERAKRIAMLLRLAGKLERYSEFNEGEAGS